MMDPKNDAYGAELKAYFETKASIEIVERDDGYIDYHSGVASYFSKYNEWSEYEKEAIKYVHGCVIDIGCGAGRVSLYLQENNYNVLGIDNSPGAVEICKKRGVKDVECISITQLNKKYGIFDTFLLFGNNFGLLGSYKRAQLLLKRFNNMSPKTALIIAQTTDPYDTQNPEHLAYHEYNRKRGRMGGQLRIRIRYKKYIGKWFDYLFVSKDELESIITGTGWSVKKYIESGQANYIVILEKVLKENNEL